MYVACFIGSCVRACLFNNEGIYIDIKIRIEGWNERTNERTYLYMYITKLIKGERISRQVQEHRPVHVDLLLLYYGYVMICAFKENSIIWGIQLKD